MHNARPADRGGTARRSLLKTRVYRRHGLRLVLPPEWKSSGRKGVVQVSSPDRSIALSLLATSPEYSSTAVLADLERSIRQSYKGARVVRRAARTRLAGQPGRSTRLSVRRGSQRLDILVVAAPSKWRTYGLTVFGRTPAPELRIAQSRAVLDSLRFRKPR